MNQIQIDLTKNKLHKLLDNKKCSYRELRMLAGESDLFIGRDYLGQTPLHYAIGLGHDSLLSFLSRHTPSGVMDRWGRTPLHLLATTNNFSVLKQRIVSGESIDCRDSRKCTPLHYAVYKRQYKATDILLQMGANPNAKNKLRETPMHYLSFTDDLRLIGLLLKHNAKVDVRDITRRIPFEHSNTKFRLNFLEMALETHGIIVDGR